MTAIEGLTQVSTVATPIAMNAWGAMSDFLIVIVMVLVFVLFARGVGRGPFVAVLLAFYCSYALYVAFPYMSYLPTAPALTAVLSRVGLYLGLTLVFYIILRRVVVSDFLYIGTIGLIILASLGTGFLIAMACSPIFEVTSIYTFTPAITALFPAKYFFWWFIAPVVGLFFLAR